jgi:hypothetical protein
MPGPKGVDPPPTLKLRAYKTIPRSSSHCPDNPARIVRCRQEGAPGRPVRRAWTAKANGWRLCACV